MPTLPFWFTGGALAAALAFFATTVALGYAWYRAAVTEAEFAQTRGVRATQRAKTAEVKRLLGQAMATGHTLSREATKAEDLAKKDVQAWEEQTVAVITAAYGQGEASLFLDRSGYVFYGDGSEKDQNRIWIDARLMRLAELMPRTDNLIVSDQFSPENFPRN
jgi:hypothetical protein